MARLRPRGGVDTASESFDARGVGEATGIADRALDAFLSDRPGVGVLTDAVQGRIVWSRRVAMPPVIHPSSAPHAFRSAEPARDLARSAPRPKPAPRGRDPAGA